MSGWRCGELANPADPACTATWPDGGGLAGEVGPAGAVPLGGPPLELPVPVGVPVVVVVDVVGADVVVVVVVVGAVLQVGTVIVLSWRVTDPVCTNTRPWTVAPVSNPADADTMMLPTNVVVVLSVAELPTCQNTLHAWAPFIKLTVLPGAVTKVDPA